MIADFDSKIAHLERMVRKLDEYHDPELPRYMLELALAYNDKKDYLVGLMDSLDQRIAEARAAKNEQAARRDEAQRDEYGKDATTTRVRSCRVLEALVNDPTYAATAGLDEGLFIYAVLLAELGEQAKSQAAYQRLINDYPSSPRVPEAYLAFADYYFDKGQLGNAINLYGRVVAAEHSPAHAYALYKLGLCHLHPVGEDEARYDASLSSFVEAIRATRVEGRTRSDKEARHVRRQSRLGLVEPYAHVGSPAEAWSLFVDVGQGPEDEDEARRMMELLAEAYAKLEKWDASTEVYESLLRLFETDPEVCEWQGRIIENARKSGDDRKLPKCAAGC